MTATAALLLWSPLLALAFGRPMVSWVPWTRLAPSLTYLFGLAQLRRAFAAMAAGDPFGPAARRALTRLGAAMILGAALQVVLVPNLIFWLSGEAGGALLDFDVAAFSVGAIGAGLMFIARLFDTAGAMATELGEFL